MPLWIGLGGAACICAIGWLVGLEVLGRDGVDAGPQSSLGETGDTYSRREAGGRKGGREGQKRRRE